MRDDEARKRRVRDEAAGLIRKLVEAQRLTPKHRILCFGCGPGVDVAWLRARNFNATGYDTHPKFGFDAVPAGRYDFVFLVYLLRRLQSDAQRREKIAEAAAYVRPGGYLLIASRDAPKFAAQAPGKPFETVHAYLEALIDGTLFDEVGAVHEATGDGTFCIEARRAGVHEPVNPVHYVEGQAAVEAACTEMAREEVLGLDVETTLEEPRTLCTIQIGAEDRTWIIDALSITDYAPVKRILEDERIEKVIHNALFEEQMLAKHAVRIRNVFDTLPASRAKYKKGSVEGGHNLGSVCERELGIFMDKTLQTSDWTQRPLSPEQLAYAAIDAEVLIGLHKIFKPPKPPENLELFPEM